MTPARRRLTRVLLVGGEGAGARVLALLLERRDVELVTVLAAASGAAGRPLAALAERNGIVLDDARRVTDPAFAEAIAAERIDLLLNVHSLHVACEAVVTAPALGAYNLHPGPLPRYAGLDAPSWAVAAGERRHAVTLHRMDAGVDSGPIAYTDWFDVGPADTGLHVASECVRRGVPLVGRLLDDIARDAVPAQPQDPARRRWHGRRAPYGGRLPWTAPARRVVDLVRAADYAPFDSPWGRFRTAVAGAEVEVLGAVLADSGEPAAPGTVVHDPDGTVRVAAADGWVAIERVGCDGRPVDAATALPDGAICAADVPALDATLDRPNGQS